ncbi:MAG: SGNH/GDSL hydrolase family protein [Saprospiraceae bacterium]|nr:SGNH/GDSL hydrolase family protein [Saprospiraceae bacterium]
MLVFINCSSSKQGLNSMSKEINYLALGDSYTIGESVGEQERYPMQLAANLRDQHFNMGDPRIIAKTGWTTMNLAEAIDDANLDGQTFDLVSLLIGVNDQYQSKLFSDYEPHFRKLLDKAISLAGGQGENVFVISIPDYAHTPFGQKKDPTKISQELNAYNEVNERVAREYGITYFNITPISRNGLQKPELVAADGLHPSGTMYKEWVDLMAGGVREKL